MIILKSCGSHSWGGIEIYILRTIEELQSAGNNVSLLCLPDSKLCKKAIEKNINVLPILKKGAGRFGAIRNLRKYLRNNMVDVIHTHLSNDLWILVPALRGLKTKLILSKCMESGVSKKDFFHKILYKRVNRIIAVSNFIKDNVLKTCPVDESKAEVIPDAIQLQNFNPEKYNKSEIRKSLGIDNTAIVIGMVGRMSPGKGHEILFESANQIMESDLNDKVKFLVVGGASFGEEEYENKLMKMAGEHALNNIMKFCGFQNNIPYYLAAMDILAFPSNEESFGGTALEAMAMKLPVVASNSGGVPDIVVDNETGFLIPRNNPGELTGALTRLVNDESLRLTFGVNGRKRVEEHFDMKENMKLFEKIYAS